MSMIVKLYKSDDRRSQLVKLNILIGAGIRGLSILASLMLVPLTINYISSELYGIWLTLSSVIQWISFFDIGFGNGLRNRLGESIAIGDYHKGRRYVSTTYALLAIIFSLLAVVSYFMASYINWSSFLNVSRQYNDTLVIVAQILLITFSVQMVLKLIQNVIQAYQLNALAALLDALGNIIALVFIYILTITMAPELPMIAIAFGLSPIFILLLASLIFYSTKFRKVAPNFKYIKLGYAKDIFSLGGEFFIVQIAALVLYQMINILISRMCGPDEVTNYNVVYKYFTVLTMVVNIVLAPIWSAFTDAYVKNDVKWMSNIYNKLIKLFTLSVIVALILVVISPIVYDLWVGDSINVSYTTTSLVGLYVVVGVWGNIHSTILNGMGKIRFQVLYSVVIMILFIPLAMVLGHYLKLPGILLAMILVNVPGFFFGRYQVIGLMNKTVSGIWTK